MNNGKLLDPTNIEVIDTIIIVSNYKAEPLIELYDFSGKLLTNFLSRGRGPLEILSTGNIQAGLESKYFYVNDLLLKKILRFNLEKALNNDSVVCESFFSLSQEKRGNLVFDKLYPYGTNIVAENRSSKGRLQIIDKEGNSYGYYLSYPSKNFVSSALTDIANAKLYASAIVMSPNQKMLAMATYSADMLNILRVDSDNNTLDSIWGYTGALPVGIKAMPMGDQVVPVHTEEAVSFYLDIAASNQFIYALYSGKSFKNKDYKYGNKVRIFDWKASSFKEIQLDVPARRITVTRDDRYLFAIAKNASEEPVLAKIELDEL